MNSKLLYAATVAISLISTVALADEPTPVTREQVRAELNAAIANGTLQRTDYDSLPRASTVSTTSREQVKIELADNQQARKALIGPLRDRSYNQYGLEALRTSVLSRNEVRNEVREAAATGTLQRTDYDDAALVARRANAHAASQKYAQRFKAVFSRKQS